MIFLGAMQGGGPEGGDVLEKRESTSTPVFWGPGTDPEKHIFPNDTSFWGTRLRIKEIAGDRWGNWISGPNPDAEFERGCVFFSALVCFPEIPKTPMDPCFYKKDSTIPSPYAWDVSKMINFNLRTPPSNIYCAMVR